MKNTLLLALLATCTLGLSAIAAPASGELAGSRLGRILDVADQLNLDASQRTQIREILKTAAPQIAPTVRSLVENRRALQDAIHATPVNEAAIRTQSAKVAAIEADLAVQRARVSAQVRALLRPDQIAELEKVQAETRSRVDRRLSRIGNSQAAQ